jgi:ABC-type uncharacterized transport system involved in gliding motility auxiliary subunit
MKKIMQFAGLAGLTTFALGVVVGLVQQKLTLVAMGHLIGGGALAVAGLAANLRELREFLGRRSVRMGPQVALQGLLIVVIMLLLNLLLARHDWQTDTTATRLYTLNVATKKVGKNLPGDLEVIASFPGGGSPEGRQRLQIYAGQFPHFKLRFIDPDKNEDLARAERLPPQMGVLFKYKNQRIWITKFDELEITNALIKATRDTVPKVWFITGHLEPELDDESPNGLNQLRDTLAMQGFELEKADLSTKNDIPPDVDILAIVAPALPFQENEIKLIDYYLNQGGAAVIFIDPLLDPRAATGLERFLSSYGLVVKENIIFDPGSHLARDSSGLWILPAKLSDHPISSELSQPRVVAYLARSLDVAPRVPRGLELTPLLSTSDSAYEKRVDLLRVPSMSPDEGKNYFADLLGGDHPSPNTRSFNLGYAVTMKHGVPNWKQQSRLDREWEMRLTVFGSGSLARNVSFSMPCNNELVTNAFNWTAGEVSLERWSPRTRGGDRLVLDENQMDMILYLSVLILPEAFMLVGLGVWWRKR